MSTLPDEGATQEGVPEEQSRRDALKKFGRYAAAAPAVVVLLQARGGAKAETTYSITKDD